MYFFGPTAGVEKFIREDLTNFAGYSASKAPETLIGKVDIPVDKIIKMDANENPYGCSPRVSRALASYPYYNIYPDAGQSRLRKLLAEHVGVGADYIVASGGSNQLIDLVVRLFVGPGDEVINCVPTFDMYRFSTETSGGTLVEVPRDKYYAVNPRSVKNAISKKTKLIFLCTPNNPTGNTTPPQDILDIINTGLPVLIDEAYYEFCGETVAPLVQKHENLMVLRSFSKWAGLAGLRIGYGIFTPRIADYLSTIRVPFNVSSAAQIAVEESLKDIDFLMRRVKDIIAERDRLFEQLSTLKILKPFPSDANFILCSVLDGRADELQQRLQNKGILVRYFDKPLLRNFIRISAGKPEHTDALMKTLREIEGEANV